MKKSLSVSDNDVILPVAGCASASTLVGCATVAAKNEAKGEIRAMLHHLGWNMWSDCPVKYWGRYKTEAELSRVCAADRVRTDEDVWKRVSERMVQSGCNMIVIDLGEACFYPSHPELAVEGTWSVDKIRAELARLRKMGLEPIPKLNFSTGHDTWLKYYGRMVSTDEYYRVCSDVIADVCEIFDSPRFLHLGYDEETLEQQRQYAYAAVRTGELWWHDMLWFIRQVENRSVRAWIWSDRMWHDESYLTRMPKSVLQSNWYYDQKFNLGEKPPKGCVRAYLDSFIDLDKAGFDQVPCGSNWAYDSNFGGLVDFSKANISPERLKGFLMAPWFFPDALEEAKLMRGCDLAAQAWGNSKE